MRGLGYASIILALSVAACEGDQLIGTDKPDAGNVRCLSDDDCADREACNVPLGVCYPLDACGDDNPCPVPQICVEGDDGYRRCIFERCSDVTDCPDLQCDRNLIPTCTAGMCICGEPCMGGCPDGQGCCIPTEMCLDLPEECMGLACPPGEFVSVTSSGAWDRRECDFLGENCQCEKLPPLPQGDVGLYSALAHDGTGGVMSAYNLDYGDLMFGFVQADTTVVWEFVDGVPTTTTSITGAIDGPRGGNSDPGADVGLYTDIATDNVGRPHVAYYDRDRGALKYAFQSPTGWRVHTVDGTGVGATGLYNALAFDMGGRPHVAYLSAREDRGGARFSSLRIAWATTSSPADASDWRFRDVESYALAGEDCEHRCNLDEVCLSSNGRCVVPDPRNNCSPTCGSDEACVNSTCTLVEPEPLYRDLPRARGLWPSLAVLGDGSVVLAYHDRVDRNLKMASIGPDLRNDPISIVIVDGTGDGTGSTDDVGLYPSLFATPGGELHVAYMNASRQALWYRLVDDTTLATIVAEEIEAGLTTGGPDGTLFGADAALVVDAGGQARVAYQNATAGDLRYARRRGADDWILLTLAGDEMPYRGSFGFYSDQALDSNRQNPLVSTYRYFLSAPMGPMNGVEVFSAP